MTINYKKAAGLCALITFLCISGPLLAQQSTSIDSSKVYRLEEIIISASKYKQSPQSVGRNVTVITHQEIQNSSYTSVSDLLADQQSVYMIGSGQTPGSLQQGFIRNTNSNHSVVMIDGVRISDPSTVNNAIDLSELSLTGIERIEIVRGSHSTLYGSSAIGGVINIITQKQGAEGFNANVETKHGRFGEGTYSTSNSIYANYTSPDGLYANAGIDQQYTNGIDATVDTVSNPDLFNPQDQDDFRKLDLMGKVGYKTERYDVYATYRREGQKVDADQGAYRDDSNAFTDFSRNLFGYGSSADFTENLSLQFNGAYSNLDRDFVNDSSLVSPNGVYDGTYNETNARGSLWENELKAVYHGAHFRVVTGASASRQTMSTHNYVYSRSQFGVYESTTDLDSLDLQEIIYNGYIHMDLNGGMLSKNLESFSLVLGARYVNHDEFGSHYTYEINPKWEIGETALLYGAITTGFNAPSLYKLYSPSFGGFTTRGNPNLDPETSTSYELGWKQELSSAVSFELSAFKTNVTDVIEYVYLWNGNAALDNLSATDYLGDTYINASRQDINGVEASLTARLNSRWRFQGNISYTKSTLTFGPGDINESYTSGNHVQIYESGKFVDSKQELDGLTRRPSIDAYASLQYRPTDQWAVKLDSRFVGSRDDVFYSSNLGPYGALDRSNVSGYNITDLSLRYNFSDRLTAIAKVENLFDTDYVELKGYRTRGRGFSVKLQYQLGNL